MSQLPADGKGSCKLKIKTVQLGMALMLLLFWTIGIWWKVEKQKEETVKLAMVYQSCCFLGNKKFHFAESKNCNAGNGLGLMQFSLANGKLSLVLCC